MSTNEIFVAGCIIIGLPIIGFVITIIEFIKMDKNPEEYMGRNSQKKSRKQSS